MSDDRLEGQRGAHTHPRPFRRLLEASPDAGPRSGGKASLPWRKAYLFLQMHREEVGAKNHQRSIVDTAFSALKRSFGETVKSLTPIDQVNGLLA